MLFLSAVFLLSDWLNVQFGQYAINNSRCDKRPLKQTRMLKQTYYVDLVGNCREYFMSIRMEPVLEIESICKHLCKASSPCLSVSTMVRTRTYNKTYIVSHLLHGMIFLFIPLVLKAAKNSLSISIKYFKIKHSLEKCFKEKCQSKHHQQLSFK